MSSQTEAYFDSPDADERAVAWLAERGVHIDPDEADLPLWLRLRALYDVSPEAVADCDAWAGDQAHDAAEWLVALNRDTPDPQEQPT